jgi:hypothetical protein
VDGFIAGPDHPLDWVFRYSGPNQEATEAIRTTGAVLGGRRGYDLDRRASRQPEARMALCEESIMDTETGDF